MTVDSLSLDSLIRLEVKVVSHGPRLKRFALHPHLLPSPVVSLRVQPQGHFYFHLVFDSSRPDLSDMRRSPHIFVIFFGGLNVAATKNKIVIVSHSGVTDFNIS